MTADVYGAEGIGRVTFRCDPEGVIEPGPVILPGDGRGQLDHLLRAESAHASR